MIVRCIAGPDAVPSAGMEARPVEQTDSAHRTFEAWLPPASEISDPLEVENSEALATLNSEALATLLDLLQHLLIPSSNGLIRIQLVPHLVLREVGHGLELLTAHTLHHADGLVQDGGKLFGLSHLQCFRSQPMWSSSDRPRSRTRRDCTRGCRGRPSVHNAS